MDPRFAALADLVIDVAREIRIQGAVPDPGIPLNQTQSQVMRYVHSHGGCSASEIADRTGLKRANVSAAITELRDLGYLVSRRDEHDGRVIRIEATARAVDTLDRLRANWAELLASAWGDRMDDLDPVIARLDQLLGGLTGPASRGAGPAGRGAGPAGRGAGPAGRGAGPAGRGAGRAPGGPR